MNKHLQQSTQHLLQDASIPALVMLSERYDIMRIPGLSKQQIITRLLTSLTDNQLRALRGDLIVANFGGLSTEELLKIVISQDRKKDTVGRARLDHVSIEQASLVEASGRRWHYTIRGHDATIDLPHRQMACSCMFFKFAAPKGVLCKHLATVLRCIPQTYAREVLIDLILQRTYITQSKQWHLQSTAQQSA